MNIGIIGVGGVGGYFGGKLTRLLNNYKEDLNIYFFARGKHLEEIKKNGLLLSTKDEGEFIAIPTLATDNVNDIPDLDVCLLCVKGYDLDNVLNTIKCRLIRNTQIIPLLNGVDIYERVKRVVGDVIVYPACVYVGTHIERYGKVTQDGGACTILLGKDPAYMQQSLQAISELFHAASIKHTIFDDVYPEIWGKYTFIAAYGMVTASEDKTLGQVLEDKEASSRVKGIMTEIQKIAEKKGINIPENLVEEAYNKAKNFPYDTKTSFQRDFAQKDKLNESELFGDTIIRLGKEVGVDTPVTLLVNEKLKSMKEKESVQY
jgi:2-dehydropantoate 2-reductase